MLLETSTSVFSAVIESSVGHGRSLLGKSLWTNCCACAARQDSSPGRDSVCHDETPLLFLDFSLHEAESASRCFTARLKKASCRCRVSVLIVCVLDPLETVPRLPFSSVSSCSPFPPLSLVCVQLRCMSDWHCLKGN